MGDELQLLPPRGCSSATTASPCDCNAKSAGASGRRKLCLADWDGDGRLDLLANGRNVDFLRSVAQDGANATFQNLGPIDPRVLAGHTTSPTVVDWDRDGVPELVLGEEDGHVYYLKICVTVRKGRKP